MCIDPVSMMVIGTVVSAAGTVAGGISSYQAGNANAKGLQEQARLRELKGKYDVEAADRQYRREQGKVLSGVAASGGTAVSFLDVLRDDAAESALEKAAIKFGAKVDATNLRNQASFAKSQGKAALIGSLFSAAGTAMTGMGKASGGSGSAGGYGGTGGSGWTTTVTPA